LNLIDEARRHRLEINDRLLAKELGVPVVPTAARQGQGIQELLKNINAVATGEFICKPHRIKSESKTLKQTLSRLAGMIETRFPGLTNARWVALRLLEGDQRIVDAIRTGELGSLTPPAQSEFEVSKQNVNVPQNGKLSIVSIASSWQAIAGSAINQF
jgi:ferrous iron transport protein B